MMGRKLFARHRRRYRQANAAMIGGCCAVQRP
jgi:S-methylmethionine-dependent homocysteine/selenocysteine methylase